MIEEINKSPDNEIIQIIWEGDYQRINQEVWDYYTENIIPYNYKPPHIQQDRSYFDDFANQVDQMYPYGGQIDFAMFPRILRPSDVSKVLAALSRKNLTIYPMGESYTHYTRCTSVKRAN